MCIKIHIYKYTETLFAVNGWELLFYTIFISHIWVFHIKLKSLCNTVVINCSGPSKST